MDAMITTDVSDKIHEIQRLLAEAYKHYFKFSDGHCKSGEGAVSIHLPAFFWDEDADREPSVEVYSYVLGPSRSHHFKTASEALEAVREWHRDEMNNDWDHDGWGFK